MSTGGDPADGVSDPLGRNNTLIILSFIPQSPVGPDSRASTRKGEAALMVAGTGSEDHSGRVSVYDE
jgi:hypothetical protein